MKARITPLNTKAEVVQCVKATGSHFFDRDTIRAFNSRVYDDVYPTKFGTLIITSEKDHTVYLSSGPMPGAWNNQRRYTVRFVACRRLRFVGWRGATYTAKRGEFIDTSDDAFGRFATLNTARTFARKQQARLSALPIDGTVLSFPAEQSELVAS